MTPDRPTLYSVAKEAGYTASHFGKCHFEPVKYGSFSPDFTSERPETKEYYLSLGMDHLALQDDKNVSIWQYDDYSRELDEAGYLAAYRKEAWNRKDGSVFIFPGPKEWHPDAWVGKKATQYIENWDREKPLFMWVSFSGPHYPIDPPKEYLDRVRTDRLPPMEYREGEWGLNDRIHYSSYNGNGGIDGCGYNESGACAAYDDEYWARMRQHYLANMALIDDQVGNVLQAAENAFGDDTLVIYTSDHGDMLGNHKLWGKNNCGYDEVLKVPFLMKKPGETDQAKRIGQRTQSIDILPTVIETIGLEMPELDGSPISKTIEDGGYEYALAEGEGFFCLSDDRYKYIRAADRNTGEPIYEFFDMENDPGCYRNAIKDPECQEAINRMQNALIDTMMGRLLP